MADQYINIAQMCLEVEDNMIFSNNGDYIFAYELSFLPRYTLSETQIESARVNWVRALQYLPTGTYVYKTDVFKNEKYDVSHMEENSFFQIATKQHFDGKPYLGHKSFVFLIFPSRTKRSKQMVNPFAISKDAVKDVVQDISILQQYAQEFYTTLSSELITVRKSTYVDVKRYCLGWFNALQEDFTTDITFENNKVCIGDKLAGIIAITNEKNLPENISYVTKDAKFSRELNDFVFNKGYADDLGLTLKCDHIYNQILRIEDKTAVIDEMIRTRGKLHSISKFGYQNSLGAKTLAEYIDFLQDNTNAELRFSSGHTNIIYYANSERELQRIEGEICEYIKKMDIMPYLPKGKRLQNIFINSFLSNITFLDEDSFYLAPLDVCSTLFISHSNYQDDKEGLYFQDRLYNRPFKFDFWDDKQIRKQSKNFVIMAPPGQGKSVLANCIENGLIDSRYPVYDAKGGVVDWKGVVVVNIDLGGSYEKLSRLYDPKKVAYYKYEPGVPLGLNPFAVMNEKPNELQIENICELIWLLIRQGKEATAIEQTSLRDIVKMYFDVMLSANCQEKLSWFTFYEFIKENHEKKLLFETLNIKPEYFGVEEFLHVGSNFTTGIYKHVFAPNNTLASLFIGKDLITFELDTAQDNPLLLSILLQIISTTIHQVIWDKGRKGLVHFDEFGKSLKFPGILARAAFYAQAIRKQNGMFGIVLQNSDQLPDNPEGNSIMGLMDTIITLPISDSIVIENLAKRKSLSKHEIVMMKSLKNDYKGDRPYSEFFIKSGDFSMVARLELPPKVLAAYQTTPEDTNLLMKCYEASDADMAKAIDQYLLIKQQQR